MINPGTRLRGLAEQYENECLTLSMQRGITTSALQQADDKLWSLTRELCEEIENVERSFATDFRNTAFKDKVLKWFVQHPRTACLWDKPSGYSGDYATIEWLCENNQAWTRFQDIFSNHVLRCTMAQQHREKVIEQQAFFSSYLSHDAGELSLADFGCGPSIALRRALERFEPRAASFFLADLDPAALEFSRTQLSRFSSATGFEYRRGDVVHMLRRLALDDRRFDGITFGGLFDYLPDRVVVFVIQKSLRLLKPHGRLFFSQVSNHNPDAVFMDWWGDWKLIQRDEDDLLRLCQEAGVDAHDVVMHRESTNCAILTTMSRCGAASAAPLTSSDSLVRVEAS